MKINVCLIVSLLISTQFSGLALAGVPETTIKCKSASGHAIISGVPEGESFDLKIQIDNSIIRYTNRCDGTNCNQKDNYGNLSVVDALFDKVFTLYFVNSENNNRGIFYALPNTVKYHKNSRGYTAEYTGVYWGDDPRSNEPFKAFVKEPGIQLICTQKNQL